MKKMRCLYSRSHFTPVENLGRLLSDSDFDTDALENVTVPNADFVTRIYSSALFVDMAITCLLDAKISVTFNCLSKNHHPI